MGLTDWLFGCKYDKEAIRASMEAFHRNAEYHKSDKFFVAHSDGTIIPPDSKENRREEE